MPCANTHTPECTFSITGVILAGGNSSRMGQNKALLSLRGKPLIETIRDQCARAGIAQTLISGSVPGYDSLPDRFPSHGPMGGICTFIDTQKQGTLLFVPVDLPCLGPETLLGLMAENDNITALHYERHPLPLLLPLSPTVVALNTHLLSQLQNNHTQSVRDFCAQIKARALTPKPMVTLQLQNTNTPQEWRKVTTHEYSHPRATTALPSHTTGI